MMKIPPTKNAHNLRTFMNTGKTHEKIVSYEKIILNLHFVDSKIILLIKFT